MNGRKHLYERFEALSNQVAGAIVTIDSVKSDVEEIKAEIDAKIMPTVTSYNMETAHRAGMWLAGKMVWATILAVATILGFIIHEIFQYFAHGTLPLGH